MKILLIGINTKYIHPAMALYQLKINSNYETNILEFTIKDDITNIYEVIKKTLSNEKYDLIGFSCYLWNIEIIKSLSILIKQDFPIYIMYGGPEVSYDAKYFLETFTFIDFIICSEGEEALNELCLYLEKKIPIEKVSNLAYILDHKFYCNPLKLVDLNKIKLATLMVKDKINQVVYLESSRGCPYRCSYCTGSLEKKVRFFPISEVLLILKELMLAKTRTVKFLDRTFNANVPYMKQIINFINEHNICTTFQFEIVLDILDDEIIEIINNMKTKCIRFEVGIQTTNSEINKNAYRTQNMDKLINNIKKLHYTNKVDIHCDLIAGMPGENILQFRKSFNETFILRCKELQLGFMKLLRGTKLLEEKEKYGYVYSPYPPYELIYNATMSKDDLLEIHKVEKSLNYYYNSNRFTKTFDYIIKNKLIDDYYDFFLELNKDLSNKQLFDLFIHLDNYFINHPTYNTIHYFLIIDYLENHKTKPKKWWKDLYDRNTKAKLYEKIININPEIKLNDLYEYSVLINNNNEYYLIIYKNYQKKSYYLNIE